jgi:hypothetical protein
MRELHVNKARPNRYLISPDSDSRPPPLPRYCCGFKALHAPAFPVTATLRARRKAVLSAALPVMGSGGYQAYLEVALEVAKEAGAVIVAAWGKDKVVEHKGKSVGSMQRSCASAPCRRPQCCQLSALALCLTVLHPRHHPLPQPSLLPFPPAGSVDLVTETDKQCEALVLSRIRAAFPDHKFIGEEGSAAQGFTDELTEAPTWMVDPVDGAGACMNAGWGFMVCVVCVSARACLDAS